MKTLQINFRVDKVDMRRLEKVAEHWACSKATAIRMLIKARFDLIEIENAGKASGMKFVR